MKKSILLQFVVFSVFCYFGTVANAETEPVVKIEIPASSINTIDVKYEKEEPSAASKALEATKETTDKTVKATKETAKKTADATKNATNKTVSATKNAAKKTAEKSKEVKDKTVTATKDFTNKTVDGTKGIIDDLNPNKPVTLESLEAEAELKTLKNEKKALKSAYNSRIKDTNAKIKAAESSTTISDVERQNRIYTLNKQKKELELQREEAINKYNTKITESKKK